MRGARMTLGRGRRAGWLLFAVAVVVTLCVYAPGLSGGWLFDDYPNIVDNPGVQPHDASIATLTRAALSSPSSEFKRPLASLSFALNYLASGLHPFWWKVTNVVIHLLNGLLVFLLAWRLLAGGPCVGRALARRQTPAATADAAGQGPPYDERRAGLVAALVAAGWMLLPINLTAVLYVVQRMESAANLFVLLGLLGYLVARGRMLATGRGVWLCWVSLTVPVAIGVLFKETAVMLPLYALLIEWIVFRFRRLSASDGSTASAKQSPARRLPQVAGAEQSPARRLPQVAGAKQSPARRLPQAAGDALRDGDERRDWRLFALFGVVLVVPLMLGLAWQLPHVLQAGAWATRDFTLTTRLLSEARIVLGYIAWTLVPLPAHLSFYHDYFHISTGLLAPWTTLASIVVLALLVAAVFGLRKRWPLVALGIALFLGCHVLTGTILPLELIYEHRNYFASFGLLLAVIPLLAAPRQRPKQESKASPLPSPPLQAREGAKSAAASDLPGPPLQTGEGAKSAAASASTPQARRAAASAQRPKAKSAAASAPPPARRGRLGGGGTLAINDQVARALPWPLARAALLIALFLWWIALTTFTAYAWGDPLRLAQDLAARAPTSPRAQYELGRTYIIYSHYDPDSPYTPLVYAPLERAAALPDSSILPQQALIFFNARMHRPLKDQWWDSMIAKLKARDPGVQDLSSIGALTKCARAGACVLPRDRMIATFDAALAHPHPSARLYATYGDYAWNVLGDHDLGLRASEKAAQLNPDEPVYHITVARMAIVLDKPTLAHNQIAELKRLNIGGRMNTRIASLRRLLR